MSNNENYQETDYSTKLSEVLGELEDDNIQSKDVEKAMRILSEYDVNIDDNNTDNFNIFILKIHRKEDEIKFCIGKTDKEIKALNERL